MRCATALARLTASVARLLPLAAALGALVLPGSAGASPGDWAMAAHDAQGTGANPAERTLGPATAPTLEVKWRFDAQDAGHPVGPIHASPVVRDGTAYVGDFDGNFYAVGRDGRLIWETRTRTANPIMSRLLSGGATDALPAPVYGAAALPARRRAVVFGDADGNVYARDAADGTELWTVPKIDPHPTGGVVGNSVLVFGDTVVIGFSSIENFAFNLRADGYPCCTHRGLVVALDVDSGREKWRYDVIRQSDVQALPERFSALGFIYGPSGADVWAQPTYDAETGSVFIGTGQHFSPGPDGHGTGRSDAIIALDARTGEERWARQLATDDIWLDGIPNPATGPSVVPPLAAGRTRYLDQDFGDQAKVYRLPDGRKVVGAGQKSGAYHVLDARTGAVVHSNQVVKQAGSLGGLQTGGAVAGLTYVHGLDRNPWYPKLAGFAGFDGKVVALSADGSQRRWSLAIPFSPLIAPLAVANGVLYFGSPANLPLRTWRLVAVDAATGRVLKGMTLPGSSIDGPVVSDGRLYVGAGNHVLDVPGLLPHDPVGALYSIGPKDG